MSYTTSGKGSSPSVALMVRRRSRISRSGLPCSGTMESNTFHTRCVIVAKTHRRAGSIPWLSTRNVDCRRSGMRRPESGLLNFPFDREVWSTNSERDCDCAVTSRSLILGSCGVQAWVLVSSSNVWQLFGTGCWNGGRPGTSKCLMGGRFQGVVFDN